MPQELTIERQRAERAERIAATLGKIGAARSVEEALAYFATHRERVKALFGLYLDRMADTHTTTDAGALAAA